MFGDLAREFPYLAVTTVIGPGAHNALELLAGMHLSDYESHVTLASLCSALQSAALRAPLATALQSASLTEALLTQYNVEVFLCSFLRWTQIGTPSQSPWLKKLGTAHKCASCPGCCTQPVLGRNWKQRFSAAWTCVTSLALFVSDRQKRNKRDKPKARSRSRSIGEVFCPTCGGPVISKGARSQGPHGVWAAAPTYQCPDHGRFTLCSIFHGSSYSGVDCVYCKKKGTLKGNGPHRGSLCCKDKGGCGKTNPRST